MGLPSPLFLASPKSLSLLHTLIQPSRVSPSLGDSCQCPLLPAQGASVPYSQHIQFKRGYRRDSTETGWDLRPGTVGCNAAMPAPGHISPLAKSTKKWYGTKNNCVHAQLGQILDPKNPSTTFKEPGAEARGQRP